MEHDGDTLADLVAYDRWATERLIVAAVRLPAARLDEASGHPGWTVRSGVAHILDALAYWHGQIEGRPAAEISAGMLPDPDAMRTAARAVSTSLSALVSGLSSADRRRPIIPRAGSPTRTAHDALVHALMHASHHRGELAALLTMLGASPGDLDYMDYLSERTEPSG